MAISPQQLTIYLYSAHRAVIFAIAQLSCLFLLFSMCNCAVNWCDKLCFLHLSRYGQTSEAAELPAERMLRVTAVVCDCIVSTSFLSEWSTAGSWNSFSLDSAILSTASRSVFWRSAENVRCTSLMTGVWMSTRWPKKSKPVSFLHIFANYWPIFKFFSLLHSVKNL